MCAFSDDTIVVTYYNAPNVEHSGNTTRVLPDRLKAKHIDPRDSLAIRLKAGLPLPMTPRWRESNQLRPEKSLRTGASAECCFVCLLAGASGAALVRRSFCFGVH